MPFRGQEPRKENRDERFNRQLEGLQKRLQEYEERKAFDSQGAQDAFDRGEEAFDRGERTHMPEVPNPDDPWYGLPSGNVPMPKWMQRPAFWPFEGIPKEAMDPKNFPIQRILEPHWSVPPPPHSPQAPPPQ